MTDIGTGLTVDGTVKAAQATSEGEAVVLDAPGTIPASLLPTTGGGDNGCLWAPALKPQGTTSQATSTAFGAPSGASCSDQVTVRIVSGSTLAATPTNSTRCTSYLMAQPSLVVPHTFIGRMAQAVSTSAQATSSIGCPTPEGVGA